MDRECAITAQAKVGDLGSRVLIADVATLDEEGQVEQVLVDWGCALQEQADLLHVIASGAWSLVTHQMRSCDRSERHNHSLLSTVIEGIQALRVSQPALQYRPCFVVFTSTPPQSLCKKAH